MLHFGQILHLGVRGCEGGLVAWGRDHHIAGTGQLVRDVAHVATVLLLFLRGQLDIGLQGAVGLERLIGLRPPRITLSAQVFTEDLVRRRGQLLQQVAGEIELLHQGQEVRPIDVQGELGFGG
jgi:hypothetical protein